MRTAVLGCAVIFAAIIPTITAQALPTPSETTPEAAAPATPGWDEARFPHLPLLKPNVEFWTQVFGEWSEHQSVIHPADYPDRVLTVLDFRDEAAVLDMAQVKSLQSQAEKREKARYARLLENVHKHIYKKSGSPDTLQGEERRLYELFAGIDNSKRFHIAADTVRAQRGLKERTARALETAGKYLPAMESIFKREGLPVELTRLPLVESSFNLDAYSKVGAAGIWQFMPSSARIYMRFNEVVDDRADPWLSTEGAARHLRDDYDALGSWPLAMTAYNHGRAGVARALQEVKGDGLEDIIERYRGKRFGFASRNFYAEFLAASDVERDHKKYFGEVARKSPLSFDQALTQDFVSYQTLRRLAGADEEAFRRLNPSYRPDVIEGKLYVPPGHLVRVPAGRGAAFRTAYASLGGDERFNQQRVYYVSHRIRKGDTLGKLARHYGVSIASIKQANAGALGKHLRVGKILRVPPRGASPALLHVKAEDTVEVAAAKAPKKTVKASKKSKKKGGPTTHRVRSGQTLSHIARRYRVSVNALREANGMGESSFIKPGQRLKIPAS